jgi:hypothetical protein
MAADPSILRAPVSEPTGARPTPEFRGAPTPLSAGSFRRQWLVQREGSFWERGRSFELSPALSEATLGRSLTCHLRVNDETVSRIHAALLRKPHRGIYLMDLASREGTFLNGERIDGDVLLMDGDRIGLGERVVLEFVDGPRPHEAVTKRWARRIGWAITGFSAVVLDIFVF